PTAGPPISSSPSARAGATSIGNMFPKRWAISSATWAAPCTTPFRRPRWLRTSNARPNSSSRGYTRSKSRGVPSNKRLKLTGVYRSKGDGVLCPGGYGLSSINLAPAGESPAAQARSVRLRQREAICERSSSPGNPHCLRARGNRYARGVQRHVRPTDSDLAIQRPLLASSYRSYTPRIPSQPVGLRPRPGRASTDVGCRTLDQISKPEVNPSPQPNKRLKLAARVD